MRKFLPIFVAGVAGLLLCIACSDGYGKTDAAEETPLPEISATVTETVFATPTPTATPEPEPVAFFYGFDDELTENLSAVQTGVNNRVIAPDSTDEIWEYPGKKVLVLSGENSCFSDVSQQAASLNISTISVVSFGYDAQSTLSVTAELPLPSTVLDAAIAFPPHDTPVRMIGVFSSTESESYLAWQQYVQTGKIFSKAEFSGETAKDAVDVWFSKLMNSFYAGMIDCVFCEEPGDALTVAQLLTDAGRDDMEIFCAAYSVELYDAMNNYPELICGIGSCDWVAALTAAAETAQGLLAGEERNDISVPPTVISKSVNAPQRFLSQKENGDGQ